MGKDYPTLRGPLPPGVKLEENVYVKMRDGVEIAIDIYRPEKEGRYPALFSMSPYIKEIQHQPPLLSHSIEAGATGFFVPQGYNHIIAQMRGTGFSQGQYDLLSVKQQQDGHDLIEWIAKQSWCDGNVGMLGDSYFSMIQYLVAAQQPPHLKCLSIFDGFTDPYRDFCYRGGLFHSTFMGMWVPDTYLQCIWPGPIKGKELPSNILVDLALNPEDGPYYWDRAAWKKFDKIKIPLLSIATSQGYVHSRGQLWGYSQIKVPKRLIVVGPCGLHAHEFFLQSKPMNEVILRWYNHWLKGIDTGIMKDPEVTIFDPVTEDWRYENEYPLARTKWTKFYFRANPSGSATNPPNGSLSLEPAGNEKPDGIDFIGSLVNIEAGKPVLVYSTPPLEKDVRVWGPLNAVLYGSSTTLDTAWFVKVADIGPDGKFTLLSDGHLKASFRELDKEKSKPGQPFHPFQKPVRPEPHKIYEYQIEMMPIFWTFKAGHKIWVHIAADDFRYHYELHTLYTTEMLPIPATNTVYHDAQHPSHVLLPVIPDAPVIKPVGPPITQIKWPL
jgi:uncharacterized protein